MAEGSHGVRQEPSGEKLGWQWPGSLLAWGSSSLSVVCSGGQVGHWSSWKRPIKKLKQQHSPPTQDGALWPGLGLHYTANHSPTPHV
jgi:hypothetical protein